MFDFFKPVSEAQKRKVRVHNAERAAAHHLDEARRLHFLAEEAKLQAEHHMQLRDMHLNRLAHLRAEQ